MQFAASVLALVAGVLVLAEAATAQRGRGRSEAIRSRVGCYFTDVKLPAAEADTPVDLAELALVKEAASKGELSVLYICDPAANATRHEQFERTMFNNDELGIAMRWFHCGRVDLSANAQARAWFGKQAPVFVAFSADGKRAGEVALTGYKASASQVVQLLEKAASGTVKPSLALVVKNYRDMVRNLEQIESQRRVLQDRIAKLDDKDDRARRAELEKDSREIDAEERRVLAAEKELLERTRLPARDPGARRAGERTEGERGGRQATW